MGIIVDCQMFGSLDIVANEWTEGIFAQLWRKYNRDKKTFASSSWTAGRRDLDREHEHGDG